ncbi:holo-ACP synthase [Cohnella faecalis]|uniref:Holo-[acyl-carrier-protein] synthase n=1 Tax=Cohnella faecalis TaxID=2315694 RepID=A0A398CNJ0_9BACL|nr:holo-ACP synthase [Cohnella faecalis]RIE02298.1 holo-[acyl-carrier-protein] synthase [Cohnella faecalis]
MIAGIGLDIVETARMEKLLNSAIRDRFAERVLTLKERERFFALPARRALEFIAGRFAAKEAVTKAIGCGIGGLVGFQDIEIMPDGSGKPVCRLSDAALDRLGWQGTGCSFHVAITHEKSMAAATAVIER